MFTHRLKPKGVCLGITLTGSCDVQEVTGFFSKPDLNWKYKDKKGHVHKWFGKGDDAWIPTAKIVAVEEPEMCGECGTPTGEMIEVDRYFCKKCEEEIEPGYLTSLETKHYPLPTKFEVEMTLEKRLPFDSGKVIKLEDYCHNAQGDMYMTQAEERPMMAGSSVHIYQLTIFCSSASYDDGRYVFLK